jgi:hypothetical protein
VGPDGGGVALGGVAAEAATVCTIPYVAMCETGLLQPL